MMEYSVIFLGSLVCVCAVAMYSVKKVSQNAKDIQVLVTAISGKTKEYGEVKLIDRIDEKKDKPSKPKEIIKKTVPEEDMLQ